LVELTVEKGIYRGLGLARAQGRAVFVARGLPGDRVRARVTGVEPGFARAAIEAVLEPGPERRPGPCPHAAACGGCAYQELDYAAQLRLKETILQESLARAGASWDGPISVTPSPREAWRTRATFHVATSASGVRVGLREEGSHRVVALEGCLHVSESMNRALAGLRLGLERRPALAARVSHIRLVEAGTPGSVLACFEGDLAASDGPPLLGLADGTSLAGLGYLVGPGQRRRYVSLAGEPFVSSDVLGLRFRVHVQSFFQANRFLVDALARTVRERTPAGGSVLDLYSGVGLFALTLASQAERVLGVEASEWAVEDAKANAEVAGLAKVRFWQADVVATLARLPAERGERVILDPPRTGAGVAVVRGVAAREPEAIVYVSCDPPTLGRDLKALREVGYRLASLELFDLFPDTFHLESVALILRD
jgi:23S rRNA (uracil1939-C5)-methyltransferase